MTEAEKHASKRLKEAVKYVSRQWGNGWPRIGSSMREALVRAEILAEIARIPAHMADPTQYRDMVDAMSTQAVQWSGGGDV